MAHITQSEKNAMIFFVRLSKLASQVRAEIIDATQNCGEDFLIFGML